MSTTHASRAMTSSGGSEVGHRSSSAEPTSARGSLPGWASVGEALDADVLSRCREVGCNLAEAGASVGEALAGLRSTTRRAWGREPTHDEACAVAEGWAETTLAYLHRLSCVDPMTGLATHAHLRERLTESYRAGADPGHRRALVVAETTLGYHLVEHSRRMTLLGESSRAAFPAASVVARLGSRRVVVLVERDDELWNRSRLLRRLAPAARVWVEALPGSEPEAVAVLDELARR
jgi:hypothetical protein